MLSIDDPATPEIDVIIADNAAAGTETNLGPSTHADWRHSEGSILFVGGVGSFPVNVVHALSKPFHFGDDAACFVVNALALSQSPGSLVIRASDTGFQFEINQVSTHSPARFADAASP